MTTPRPATARCSPASTKTGPVVTTAALSISVVFLGFLLGGLTAVKEIGFGMVVAVVLDVTVVRGLLLPAHDEPARRVELVVPGAAAPAAPALVPDGQRSAGPGDRRRRGAEGRFCTQDNDFHLTITLPLSGIGRSPVSDATLCSRSGPALRNLPGHDRGSRR